MAIQKLPMAVQSMLSAQTLISSYLRAIEELVYNSLDAESTSIAIRINIEENKIQVIDNGCGIAESDFSLLGQRHTTSKCIDVSALKSAPNKYGFRGQSLASIIEISQNVKVSSRWEKGEKTLQKSFYESKHQLVSEKAQRPSKGTTIEIKGFLYNLNIQNKTINSIRELSEIKTFLEKLSLVHSNISLSLRDDSKNEIIFNLHKKRDIFQTLFSIFGVNKADLQELTVEKNKYKVKAFIGKNGKEIDNHHWIYLNGKLVNNNKLYTTLNDYFSKLLCLKHKSTIKQKPKRMNNEHEILPKMNKIPFYIAFIVCPYYDYAVSYTSKQSMLEFKSWEHINKLLEKLVKFYNGDMTLKPKSKFKDNLEQSKEKEDTRDQVKKIMERILGNQAKRPGISQMHNGIKGKLIKRNTKKKTNKLPLTKVISPIVKNKPKRNQTEPEGESNKGLNSNNEMRFLNNIIVPPKTTKTSKDKRENHKKGAENVNKPGNKRNDGSKKDKVIVIADTTGKHKSKSPKKLSKTLFTNKPQTKDYIKKKYLRTKIRKRDDLVTHFQKGSDSVKKRCNILAKQVDALMSYKKKRKRKIFINETVQYSSVIKDNRNISVRKKVGEIVIHDDCVPLPPKHNKYIHDEHRNELQINAYKSSYDLMQTVLKTQNNENLNKEITAPIQLTTSSVVLYHGREEQPNRLEADTTQGDQNLPKLTFNSHQYHRERFTHINNDNQDKKSRSYQFITKQCKDNFDVQKGDHNFRAKLQSAPKKQFNFKIRKPYERRLTIFDVCNSKYQNRHASSYTIECSQSIVIDSVRNNEENIVKVNNLNINNNTFIIDRIDERISQRDTFIIDRIDNYGCIYGSQKNYQCENERNISEITKRVQHDNELPGAVNIEPLDVCETVLTQHFERDIEPNKRMWNDSLINSIIHNSNEDKWNDTLFDGLDVNSLVCDRNAYTYTQTDTFQLMKSRNHVEKELNIFSTQTRILNVDSLIRQTINENEGNVSKLDCSLISKATHETLKLNMKSKTMDKEYDLHHFNFKNRPRFVPKGMSPIFENCQTKNACDYIFENDYYKKAIYSNFANNVQVNAEIFEPKIQNLQELSTKHIEKASSRLNRDNASLKFNAESLNHAIVFGQVDNKFISAKIKSNSDLEATEFLVLFDQHAVHERIRLETNLEDYFNGHQWKSTILDHSISLKLTKDEVLFLHNYADKFAQFGLDWTVLDHSEVSISAIPKALLGKNLRQVEVVMMAVKNLIAEEIYAIKSQRGCVSLYPKSIMDLVLSEACRYAIKFGDRLSSAECVDLVKALSGCKTPFQCAHGRPVMAVLMELKSDKRIYKINSSSVARFQARTNRKKMGNKLKLL